MFEDDITFCVGKNCRKEKKSNCYRTHNPKHDYVSTTDFSDVTYHDKVTKCDYYMPVRGMEIHPTNKKV